MSFDLAVFGAGSAGIAAIDLAARRGARAIILDREPFRGFASLRNQGWLHSGALYVSGPGPSRGGSSIVEKCRAGMESFRRLQDELKEPLIGSERGLFVFDSLDSLYIARSQIEASGLACRLIDVQELKSRLPYLGVGTTIVGGVECEDTTVNTPLVLNRLLERALANGAVFQSVPKEEFENVRLDHLHGEWVLSFGTAEPVRARACVLSCGALIPKIVRANFGREYGGEVSRAVVLGVPLAVVDRLILFKTAASHYMNVAPAPGGFTVNLGGLDSSPAIVDDHVVDVGTRDTIVQIMRDYLPGLAEHMPTSASFYVCQKYTPGLDGATRASNSREFHLREFEPGLFVLYPGKFTQSLVSAHALLERISLEPIAPRARDTRRPPWRYDHPISTEESVLLYSTDDDFAVV